MSANGSAQTHRGCGHESRPGSATLTFSSQWNGKEVKTRIGKHLLFLFNCTLSGVSELLVFIATLAKIFVVLRIIVLIATIASLLQLVPLFQVCFVSNIAFIADKTLFLNFEI